MEGEAFEALVASIKAQGFLPQFPIYTYRGRVLEGWTRHRASKKARVEAVYQVFEGDDADALAFVCAANALRRHLTNDQKREVVAGVLKQNPKLSDRQIASMVGVSPTTVGSVRSTVQVGQLGKRVGKDGKARKQPRKPTPTKPKPDEDTSRMQAAAKRTLRAGKHVWKFDDGYGNGEKWYAILPAPSHDADGTYPYLFDDDGKFGPYDTEAEAEAAYTECKNGWGYEDEPEATQPEPANDDQVKRADAAEERARQAESNFAAMQTRFFQASSELTALKAQTAQANGNGNARPVEADHPLGSPVQSLADDLVWAVMASGLTLTNALAAIDVARVLVIKHHQGDDDEPDPTEPHPVDRRAK